MLPHNPWTVFIPTECSDEGTLVVQKYIFYAYSQLKTVKNATYYT